MSSTDDPSIDPPRRKLAPHRKYAKKFLTLPDELLTSIADNVAPEDLPNFRLTCKTLSNIAAKQFGEKRLAHRRFILAEYSLKGLVDMTAHPIFGPCIKSIMFGTDYLSNDLLDLMEALESHKITDPAKAMDILQMYRERWIKRGTFLKSPVLSSMLEAAFTNISLHGTSPSLGIFNSAQARYYREDPKHGYGSSREYGNLPFTKFATLNRYTLAHLQDACRNVQFRPKLLEFDLTGQEGYGEMDDALSKLLLTNGQLRSDIDVCIREGWANILISPTRNLLEFKQRSTSHEELTSAEHIRLQLSWLGSPMLTAFIAASITHFRMESCSMYSNDFIDLFQDLAETLQVVELIDVAIWGEQNFISSFFPVLHCLRDDLQLQRLVLDNLRATNKDYGGEPSGITVVVGRYWNGQQRIREGLNVLTGFGEYGLDDCKLDDWFERGIRSYERRLQRMNVSEDEHPMDHTERMDERVQLEEDLEHEKKEYTEYKATRAKVKEAMARVEAGDFST